MREDETEKIAQTRVGTVINGKWTVDRLIGVGGMASVYAATHRNSKRAALKIMHPELSAQAAIRERFLREGYLSNLVDHPGVVKVDDDDVTEDGCAFLVMELVEGETLEARLRRKGALPAEEVMSFMDQVLHALATAHTRGVIHRDLKPENILLATNGEVKLLDFGIARARALSTDPTKTLTEGLMGTPAFMPPEQARGRWEEVDAQSDVWALGATMFTLLTGRNVHQAATTNEALAVAMMRHAPRLEEFRPDLPPVLLELVNKALNYEKRDRWPNATVMLLAIRKATVRIEDEALEAEARAAALAVSRDSDSDPEAYYPEGEDEHAAPDEPVSGLSEPSSVALEAPAPPPSDTAAATDIGFTLPEAEAQEIAAALEAERQAALAEAARLGAASAASTASPGPAEPLSAPPARKSRRRKHGAEAPPSAASDPSAVARSQSANAGLSSGAEAAAGSFASAALAVNASAAERGAAESREPGVERGEDAMATPLATPSLASEPAASQPAASKVLTLQPASARGLATAAEGVESGARKTASQAATRTTPDGLPARRVVPFSDVPALGPEMARPTETTTARGAFAARAGAPANNRWSIIAGAAGALALLLMLVFMFTGNDEEEVKNSSGGARRSRVTAPEPAGERPAAAGRQPKVNEEAEPKAAEAAADDLEDNTGQSLELETLPMLSASADAGAPKPAPVYRWRPKPKPKEPQSNIFNSAKDLAVKRATQRSGKVKSGSSE